MRVKYSHFSCNVMFLVSFFLFLNPMGSANVVLKKGSLSKVETQKEASLEAAVNAVLAPGAIETDKRLFVRVVSSLEVAYAVTAPMAQLAATK